MVLTVFIMFLTRIWGVGGKGPPWEIVGAYSTTLVAVASELAGREFEGARLEGRPGRGVKGWGCPVWAARSRGPADGPLGCLSGSGCSIMWGQSMSVVLGFAEHGLQQSMPV